MAVTKDEADGETTFPINVGYGNDAVKQNWVGHVGQHLGGAKLDGTADCDKEWYFVNLHDIDGQNDRAVAVKDQSWDG